MEVEIKDMPEFRVGAVRHVGPYDQIPLAFERLGQIGGPAGLFQHPGAAMMAIYHDDPETTPKDQLRAEAAVVVAEHVTLPDGLIEERIPAGRYARTVHIGPYENLGDAWAHFKRESLPASGHRPGRGVSYEIYRNTPMTAPKEELRTDMYVPIER